jgi:predicted O-methyltransferase YrrM
MVFIDGPKSHQDVLVNKFIKQLNPNGVIVVDNIYLKKFNNLSNLTKNQKALIDKVRSFRE